MNIQCLLQYNESFDESCVASVGFYYTIVIDLLLLISGKTYVIVACRRTCICSARVGQVLYVTCSVFVAVVPI